MREPVSYTHLDVYKRQILDRRRIIGARRASRRDGLGAIGCFSRFALQMRTLGEFDLGGEIKLNALMTGALDIELPETVHLEVDKFGVGIEFRLDEIFKHFLGLILGCLLYTSRCV